MFYCAVCLKCFGVKNIKVSVDLLVQLPDMAGDSNPAAVSCFQVSQIPEYHECYLFIILNSGTSINHSGDRLLDIGGAAKGDRSFKVNYVGTRYR